MLCNEPQGYEQQKTRVLNQNSMNIHLRRGSLNLYHVFLNCYLTFEIILISFVKVIVSTVKDVNPFWTRPSPDVSLTAEWTTLAKQRLLDILDLKIGNYEDLVLFLKLKIGCPPTWGALSGALNFFPF